MINHVAWVYLMTNKSRTVIYTGFTTDLPARMWEHSTRQIPTSFTARYKVDRLIYFEGFLSVIEAESAEQYIKGKKREWKCALIEKHNPSWKDLIPELKTLIR
jgi:putative endonuclease